MTAPARLRPDNFTPATRTPWGGSNILEKYKTGLGLEYPPGTIVGESWEVSVEPSFPSRLESGGTLAEVIEKEPEAWLGAGAAHAAAGQLPLLVKLIDARQDLSLQVHPACDDPGLGAGESGKLESWVILEALPGASIYLGFREGVGPDDVRGCIDREERLDQLMNLVPVAAGDVFVIRPGTPHSLGAGITLVEPEVLTPGRREVTYRFWDWNRRYDEQGRVDPAGRPRPLHVQRSLEVTDWSAPRGAALIESCRALPRRLQDGPARRDLLLAEPGLTVESLQGTGRIETRAAAVFTALTCVGGTARIATGEGTPLTFRCGQSVAVPAACSGFAIELDRARVVAVLGS